MSAVMGESGLQPISANVIRYVRVAAECAFWIAPIGLAAVAHLGASMKAGQRFVVNNVRTQNAEAAYYFVDSIPWVFQIYGVVMVALCVVTLMAKLRLRSRSLILLALSIPIMWYLPKAFFLMGKFIDWF